MADSTRSRAEGRGPAPGEGVPGEGGGRYAALFHAIRDAVLVHPMTEEGSSGRFLEVNDAACRMLGYSRQELLGMSIADIDDPAFEADRAHVFEEFRCGRSVFFERVHLAKNGRRIPVEIHCVPVELDGRRVALSTVRDISDRKRIEEALRREHELLTRIMEAAPMGVVMVDRRGRVAFANPYVRRRLGLSEDEVSARSYGAPEWRITGLDGSPVPDEEMVFRRVMDTGQPVSDLRQITTPEDGERVLISMNAVPVLGKSGEPDGMIATVEDITEKVRAEEALRVQLDVASALSATSDLGKALDRLLEVACQMEGIDCGGVYVVDSGTGRLELLTHRGLGPEFVERASTIEADSPQAAKVRSGKPFYVRYREDPVAVEGTQEIEGLRAVAVIPIQHDGESIAVLNLGSHSCDEIPATSCRSIEAIAAQLGGTLARIRAEAALRESQRDLQALFDSVNDFLLIIDLDTRLLQANPEAQRRLGYSADEISAMKAVDLHPPSQRERAAAILGEIMAGETTSCPVPLMARDGSVIHVETRMSRGRWGGREVLFGVSRDITDLRKAEEKAAQLGRLLDHLLNEIYVLDAETRRVLQVNRGARENLGYSTRELESLTVFELQPELSAEAFAALSGPLRSGAEQRIHYETVHRRKDGSVYPVEVFLQLATFRSVPAFVAIVNDIAQRRRAEGKLRQLAEAQAVLLLEVNHRVKNNLAAIISILEKEQDRAERSRETSYLPLLRELVIRVRALATVHSMLSERGWRPLLLSELCDNVIRAVVQATPFRRSVEVHVRPSSVRIGSAQAHHLTLALNELATNSVKYGPTESGTLGIAVSIEAAEREVTICYRDDGPGFPNELAAGDLSGASIGLDLVHGIVTRSLRGRLELRNDNGAVATIRFENEAVPEVEEG